MLIRRINATDLPVEMSRAAAELYTEVQRVNDEHKAN